MSRPPRIPNWLPWEQRTIYFITLCIEARKPVLANVQAWKICRAVFDKLDQWRILSAIAMPDHLHILAAPTDRMHPSAISRNGLSAGSTKHIALRIVGRLCQTAPQRLGDGKKVVSIACCDLMNPCRTNGNTSDRIRSAAALSNIRTTGHTSFNSTLSE